MPSFKAFNLQIFPNFVEKELWQNSNRFIFAAIAAMSHPNGWGVVRLVANGEHS